MIGIIGAMEQETRTLLGQMENIERKTVHHLEYISGTIYGKEVVLTQSGIGKVNSALATAFLIDRYQPSVVINTGSAGGLQPNLTIGEVVIGKEVAYHDVDATAFGYTKGQVPQMPATYQADAAIAEQVSKAATAVGLRVDTGLIVSSDSFVANPKEVERIKHEFPEAKATEMEGASIAQVCYQMKVPFLIVRAISDSANDEASVTFDEFIEEAGKKSAEMILHFLNQ